MIETYNKLKVFCSKHNVSLVAVTKKRTETAIMDLYNSGHRAFGENRMQELVEKFESLPKDIEWHMIGHLQSNKVKYMASFVTMIQSGANYSLLKEINKRAKKHDRTIDVLLQIKIGKEETKSGWDEAELFDHLQNNDIQALSNIIIRGVMGMATFTDDDNVVRSEFSKLKSIFEQMKITFYNEQKSFDTISMGMSGDYRIAIEEGSTMIRVGSLLFE